MGLYEMFEEICDSYKFDSLKERNKRYVTFKYDATNDNDTRIKKNDKRNVAERTAFMREL